MQHKIYLSLITGALSLALTSCGSTTFGTSAATVKRVEADAAKAAPTMTSLALTPDQATLPLGETQQFTATASFSDGSKADVTGKTTFTVDDKTIADNASGSPAGLFKALKVGTTKVSGKNGSSTATSPLTVVAAELKSIAVTPSPISADVGSSSQLKAVGTYSDGTTADITQQVTWASGDQALAGVSSTGVLTPTKAGTNTVTASLGGVNVTVPATYHNALACTSGVQAVNASGTTVGVTSSAQLTWSGLAGGAVSFSVAATSANPPATLGTVAATANASGVAATYTAPPAVAAEVDLAITATPADPSVKPASCTIRLVPNGAIGIVDDGQTQGLVGNVYQLPRPTPDAQCALPSGLPTIFANVNNWASNPKPVLAIVMPQVNVPVTYYTAGFPGLPTLNEWFAIKLDGQLRVPTTGAYTFGAICDDGCNVYLDGQLLLSEDGCHAANALTPTAPKQLTAGLHSLHIDYYQGPPVYLALSLDWQGPGDSAMALIPAANLLRPAKP